MKQQLMTAPGRIIFREVPVPEVKENEVKIKMMRVGICGSDIHVYHGKHPFTSYPVTQGHEVSGEVVEIGRGVTQLKPGDRVTVEPQIVCGECYPCVQPVRKIKGHGFSVHRDGIGIFRGRGSEGDEAPIGYDLGTGSNDRTPCGGGPCGKTDGRCFGNGCYRARRRSDRKPGGADVDVICLVGEKKVALDPLISRVFPFEKYQEAYRFIEENREEAMKIIVNIQE